MFGLHINIAHFLKIVITLKKVNLHVYRHLRDFIEYRDSLYYAHIVLRTSISLFLTGLARKYSILISAKISLTISRRNFHFFSAFQR